MNLHLSAYQNRRVCVAVSGGGDSVALLHYFHLHGVEYGIEVSAVNCEHGIRGEQSLSDSAFVARLCAEWNVPLHAFSADCVALAARDKVSLESAARAFRYTCFEKILRDGEADLIATAHHRGDNAETILFRLCRGASLTGAGGISEREGFIRPLLSTSGEEICRYLEENHLSFCHDATNEDDTITRNAIRLHVLPELEKAVPSAAAGIVRFSALAKEDDEFLYSLASPLVEPCEGGVKIRLSEQRPLFRRAALLALKSLGVEKDYSAVHLETLFALQAKENGERASMPGNIVGIREYDGIVLYRPRERTEEELPFGMGTFCLQGKRFFVTPCEKREEGGHGYVDLRKIPPTAVFRTRREGDRFARFGGGTKKLKDYLIDCKMPRRLRDELIVLADGREILAIVGGEISGRVCVDEESVIARITMDEKGD